MKFSCAADKYECAIVFLYGEEKGSAKSQRESTEQNYLKAAVIQVLPFIKAHILRAHEELFFGL